VPPAWMNTLNNSGTQQNAQYRPKHGYLSGYHGSRPGLMSGPTAITAGSAGSNQNWWNQPGGAGAPRGMPGATGASQQGGLPQYGGGGGGGQQFGAGWGSWTPSNKPQVAPNQGSWSNIRTDPAQKPGMGTKPGSQFIGGPPQQQPQQGQGNWSSPYSSANSGWGGPTGGQPQGAWGGGTPTQGGGGQMAGLMQQMYGNGGQTNQGWR